MTVLRLLAGLVAGVATGYVASDIRHQIAKSKKKERRGKNSRGVADELLDDLVKCVDSEREGTTRLNRQEKLRKEMKNRLSEYRMEDVEKMDEEPIDKDDFQALARSVKDLAKTVGQMREDLYRGRNDTPRMPKNEDHSRFGNGG